ncbi:MAG: haloacid dehalogenase-like hydrolase [Alphaproteobacteria bacterium]|nr:haloacid dehalogenase-like hydrolase [Alphaproteobacteria bacterium]
MNHKKNILLVLIACFALSALFAKTALFTSSASGEGSDALVFDEGIAPAIPKEKSRADDSLAGDRKLTEEANKAAKTDPLSSWNNGATKQAILDFVQKTTDQASQDYIPAERRIAAFDQDGTLWVEQPMCAQSVYCLERVKTLVAQAPELKSVEPFKTVLSGNRSAIEKLEMADLIKMIAAIFSGMSVEEFSAQVSQWLAEAKHPRWNRLYTELTYQPMQELLQYLRANGYRTYIVTGGGQDFVRAYANEVYGIPPEQIIGTTGETKYVYAKDGQPRLIKEHKFLFHDNFAGKPEGIHFVIGRQPVAAFGNSAGDQQMLEYTQTGNGKRLMMLVLHDDQEREYLYGPAQGLPDSKVGTFTQALYDEAKKRNWIIISMKNDWKQIFSFEK